MSGPPHLIHLFALSSVTLYPITLLRVNTLLGQTLGWRRGEAVKIGKEEFSGCDRLKRTISRKRPPPSPSQLKRVRRKEEESYFLPFDKSSFFHTHWRYTTGLTM